jgi:type I restriction-modification system DNA methylase subunit
MAQQELEKYLWGAGKILLGTIDARDYKQDNSRLLSFKWICDVYDQEFENALGIIHQGKKEILYRVCENPQWINNHKLPDPSLESLINSNTSLTSS